MTRHELLVVRRLRAEIARQEEYVRELRDLQTSQERLLTTCQPMGYRSRLEGFVMKVMLAEERLNNLRGRLLEYGRRLREKILAETDGLLSEVLIARYVECLTWTQAAELLQVSRTKIYMLHKNFLKGLAENVKA